MHVSIHPAYMHTLQICGRRHGELHLALASGWERAPPFPLSLLPRSPGPLPKGEQQLNYGKERRKEIPGSEAPAAAPPVPFPYAPSPPPLSPVRGGRGCGGAKGSCPAPPEQSPPREPAAAHRAGDKGGRAAPSSKSALQRRSGKEALGGGERFAPCFSWTVPSCSCVPSDLLGWFSLHLFAVPHPYLPLSCPFRSPIALLFSPPYSFYLLSFSFGLFIFSFKSLSIFLFHKKAMLI